MAQSTKGFWALLGCCVIWGLSGIFYKALTPVPVLEVLAHRSLWSLLVLLLWLGRSGRIGEIGAALRGRQGMIVTAAALTVSSNWFVFIWAVQSGQAVASSLGYYIFPLLTVSLGVVVLHERLGRIQGLAVALAALAVGILGWGLGAAPWVSLFLAASFALYGLLKKRLVIAPVVSVAAEVAVLFPLVLLYLLALHFGWFGQAPGSGHFGQGVKISLLLALSGLMTALPLILFSYAAQRVRLSTLGLTQYLNPTLQLLVAVFLFGERLTLWHIISLPLIWLALGIYAASLLARDRDGRDALAP